MRSVEARCRLAIDAWSEPFSPQRRLEENVGPLLVRVILGRAIEMLDMDASNRVPS